MGKINVKTFTVEELESKIEELIESGESGWDSGWYSPEDQVEELSVPGYGHVEYVDDFGGEGMGDTKWVVFKVCERYFKKSGSYDSWNGTEWDYGYFKEVKPVEVKVIEYKDI